MTGDVHGHGPWSRAQVRVLDLQEQVELLTYFAKYRISGSGRFQEVCRESGHLRAAAADRDARCRVRARFVHAESDAVEEDNRHADALEPAARTGESRIIRIRALSVCYINTRIDILSTTRVYVCSSHLYLLKHSNADCLSLTIVF